MQLINDQDRCPDGWKLMTVGTACNICDNLRLPLNVEQREQMQGPYPYYGPTGVLDHLNEYRLEGKYALIGEDGDHFLKYWEWPMTQLVEGRLNVNNHAHVVQGNNGCLTEWFYLYFNHMCLRPILTLQGVGRYKLTRQALESLPIAVPPLAEQERIVAILQRWTDAITLTDKLIARKHCLRHGVMQQLLTGRRRFPEFKTSSFMELHIGDVLKETFRPVDWNEGELYRLASIRRHSGGLFWREALYGKQIKVKKLHSLCEGDFLISHIQAAYGAMGLVPAEFAGGKVSDMYTILTPKVAGTIDMRYIDYLSQMKRMRHQAYLACNGFFAERLRLNFDPAEFLKQKILLPSSVAEQRKIADLLDTLVFEIRTLERELDALKKQKKGLMQKLLAGEIRVKEFNHG